MNKLLIGKSLLGSFDALIFQHYKFLTDDAARLMRLLAAVGVIDEVAENTYMPNKVTHFNNQPGFIGAEKHQ